MPDPITKSDLARMAAEAVEQVLVLCEHCGSEGHIYSGHPNDPNPRYVGECPVCEGDGRAWVDAEPVDCDDLVPLVPA